MQQFYTSTYFANIEKYRMYNLFICHYYELISLALNVDQTGKEAAVWLLRLDSSWVFLFIPPRPVFSHAETLTYFWLC